MFEKLTSAANQHADAAVEWQIDRLANIPTPPGVIAQPIDGGIALTGKGLRRRMLNDPNLRNFGR